MFESIVTEYLDQTKSKDWTVLGSLEFTRSKPKPKLSSATINDFKEDLYAVLQRYKDKCNIRMNAKNKGLKILSNFNSEFSTTEVKRFIKDLEFLEEARLNVTSTYTVTVLKLIDQLRETGNRREHEKIIRPLNVEEDQDRLSKRQRQDDELDEELTSPSPLQDSYMKDPEYFDSLVDNVDLSYIGREEEPMSARLMPTTISVISSWDSFKIDDVDVVEFFDSLRDFLPKRHPEIHPQYSGVLDLTGQHKPTKKKFTSKWKELLNNFQLDIAWKMVELDQSEIDFFDNIEDSKAQQKVLILHTHLTILKEYLRNIKLPINEGELMIHIVAPAFRMSIDQNQEKFRKLWCERQLVASQERRPILEGFICEVSGGLPAGCPKKIWTDRLKIMVGMRDMINSIMKSFPGLLPEDYMKIVVFGSQVIGLQINLYVMYVRAYGIYRFGIIDKVFLPASMQELSAYESVHVMLRSLEHRLSNLTEYCSDLKVKHARLRRKHQSEDKDWTVVKRKERFIVQIEAENVPGGNNNAKLASASKVLSNIQPLIGLNIKYIKGIKYI
nr:11593_t:CDS:2 [Entrophospora candida]